MDSRKAEFAILKIAFLLTALDGHIDESEREMFEKLTQRCREVDVDQAKVVREEMDQATKRLLAVKSGKTDSAFLKIFLQEVEAVCDWEAFVKDSARVRRAFLMWTAMAKADHDYSAIERKAMALLVKKVNSYPLINEEFLMAAETGLGKMQDLDIAIAEAGDLATSKKLHESQKIVLAELASLVNG